MMSLQNKTILNFVDVIQTKIDSIENEGDTLFFPIIYKIAYDFVQLML